MARREDRRRPSAQVIPFRASRRRSRLPKAGRGSSRAGRRPVRWPGGWLWGSLVLAAVIVYGMLRFDVGLEELRGKARIVDGDTFWLEGRKIRLFGIDAPELRQVCWQADGTPWRCGRRARKRLAELLRQGEVRCHTLEQDRYGRDVARCEVEGEDISALLVREGLAVAYGYESPYRMEEWSARQAGRGLWAGTFERPEDFRRRKRRWN